MKTYAIEAKNLSYQPPRSTRTILEKINLFIPNNSITLVSGPTGSGKSTLLKLLRGFFNRQGQIDGQVLILGKDLTSQGIEQLGSKVALVFQNPSYQLHQPRVFEELISGPIYQSLSWKDCLDRAENVASKLNIFNLMDKNPSDLSIGEQQKVALAASLSMDAEIILMDEPFAYLDNGSTLNYLKTIFDLREQGKTIIIAAHSFFDLGAIADQMILLNAGRITQSGTPKDVIFSKEFSDALDKPFLIRVGEMLFNQGIITDRYISWDQLAFKMNVTGKSITQKEPSIGCAPHANRGVLEMNSVDFRYKGGIFALKHISMSVNEGEIFGIIGSNGCGKSTLLKVILGLIKPTRGTVFVFGKKSELSQNSSRIGYIVQNPTDMIFETSVERECEYSLVHGIFSKKEQLITEALSNFGILDLKSRDPHSLSGGEQRQLTFAAITVKNPDLFILDEPEFGLDYMAIKNMIKSLLYLKSKRKTIVIVTHDLELAFLLCDRISLMKDGEITLTDSTETVLSDTEALVAAGLNPPLFIQVLKNINSTDRSLLLDSRS